MLRHQTLFLPFSYAVIIKNANWMEFVQGMYIGELGILSHGSFQIRMLLDIDINCYSILISTRYYLLHTMKRCFSGIWKMCQNADFSCLCIFNVYVHPPDKISCFLSLFLWNQCHTCAHTHVQTLILGILLPIYDGALDATSFQDSEEAWPGILAST